MKYLTLAMLLGCAHVAPLSDSKITYINQNFSTDIKWDHDQVLMCVYAESIKLMKCMTPEEFQFRAGLVKDTEPDDPEPDSLPTCTDTDEETDGGCFSP